MTPPLAEFKNTGLVFVRKRLFSLGDLGRPALTGVNLTLEHGETLALVGESGSGKTTLGRLLNGALRPTSGTVFYRGRDLHSLRGDEKREAMRNIRMVFQDSAEALNPSLSIAASLSEPLEAFRIATSGKDRLERVASLLRRVGLPEELARRYPRELSGGQRQRVGIARALASEPELLICDEPVSSLDVSIQAQILRLLNSLQKARGCACLFISHDMGVVRAISDRVCVLYRGVVCEVADTEEVYERPLHPYTRCLLDSIPAMEPGARERALRPSSPEIEPIPETGGTPEGLCPFLHACPRSVALCLERFPEEVETPKGRFRCFNPF